MTLNRISGALAPALLAAVVGTGAPTVQADGVKLKAASFLSQRVIFARHFYEWAAKVNAECAGEVEISVVGPAAIPSFEQWNAIKTGVIDMHFGPPNYYKGDAVEAGVTILAENSAAVSFIPSGSAGIHRQRAVHSSPAEGLPPMARSRSRRCLRLG